MGEPGKKPPVTPLHADGSPRKRSNRRRRNGNNGNKMIAQTAKFYGGKEELDGNHFDCTGYGQSDRFVKTVQKIADYIGQEYKGGESHELK
jgi:hypothetical protein